MKSWYSIKALAPQNQTEIAIFDEIGGWGVSAKQFISDLKSIPADHHITLRIHSPGGEVFDGNAISNALKRHPGGVSVQIEGLAASMATVISLAGSPVKMAENGFYMIHNPWGLSVGNSDDMRKQADLLEKITEGMVNSYAQKTGAAHEQVKAWMDAETWFSAAEALAAGFVDEITDALPIAASATRFKAFAKFKNPPPDLTQAASNMDEIETPEETIESRDLSKPVEQPAVEAAPEAPATPAVEESPDEPEVVEDEVEDEDEVDESPEMPQASIPGADAILARFNAAIGERDAARAERDAAVNALASERTALANLERSLGVGGARTVPVIGFAQAETLTATRAEFQAMNPQARMEFVRNLGTLTD